jgi:preprotein translocase subunit SecD
MKNMENKQKKEKIQNVKEEKRERIIKIITACLITILISMIGFVGIYTQKQNQMKNQIKDYDLSMDLKGARILSIKPKEDKETIIKDTEGNKITEELTDEQITEKGYTKEEVNKNAEKLTKENFEKTKTIIQKRLKNMGIENYIIRLNEETGEIFIELEENTETDTIVSNIGATGKFEIQDSETKEVLLDNSDIKLVDVRYNTAETGTDVYLNIQFDKEGKNKLTEITENYKTINTTTENTTTENTTTKNTTTENTTSESETTEAQKKVVIKIDDEEVTTTSFDNIIRTGSLQLTVGKSSTSRSKINENAKKANNIASTLSFGNLPVDYEVSQNEYILSNITTKKIQQLITIIAIIAVIGLIALMLRYKLTGVLSSIAFIGFTALYLLLVRYANVIITLEGIFGIAVILVINYILTNKIANSNEKEKTAKEVKKEYGKSWLKIIPICIISIVFSFARWTPIASLGMVMLWGLALSAVYQLFITIPLIKINDKSNK